MRSRGVAYVQERGLVIRENDDGFLKLRIRFFIYLPHLADFICLLLTFGDSTASSLSA